MNRRHFLGALLGSAGFAASWRSGYGAQAAQTIPVGADAVVPSIYITGLDSEVWNWDSLEAITDVFATFFGDYKRAKALYAMYAVHIAKAYGETPGASTLEDFLTLDRSECGTFTRVQQQVSAALGLTTRRRRFADAFHGWLEVDIDGRWEIFDATANVWVNASMDELLTGVPRQYRYFYTPCLDENAPDVFRAHLSEGYSVPALRARMPYLGLESGATFAPLEDF